METNKLRKSVWIPKDMVDEIKRDAKARDTDFSKEVNRRLKHRDDTNYPMFLAKTQTIINLCMFALFRLYNDLWEYASVDDAIRITFTVGLSTLITAVFLWIIGVRLPIRVFFTALFVMVILVGGVRMLFRIFRNKGRVLKRLNSKSNVCSSVKTRLKSSQICIMITILLKASKRMVSFLIKSWKNLSTMKSALLSLMPY